MTDTGLACHLMRLSSPDALLGHPSFGALFETFAVLECIRQTQQMPTVPTFYHYRQHSGAEVDLVAELDGRLLPVEIKAASMVGPRDTLSIRAFRERMGDQADPALVTYAGERALRLDRGILAIPFDARLGPKG